jgi:hypothetical protein
MNAAERKPGDLSAKEGPRVLGTSYCDTFRRGLSLHPSELEFVRDRGSANRRVSETPFEAKDLSAAL